MSKTVRHPKTDDRQARRAATAAHGFTYDVLSDEDAADFFATMLRYGSSAASVEAMRATRDEYLVGSVTAYPPTPEQQNAIDLFATGKTLVIEAGAGTGKTSTLQFLARSTTRRGQYVAFNAAIVAEARTKFPKNVACQTAHALAVRSIVTPGFDARQRQGKRMRSIDIANRLGINAVAVTTADGERKLLSSTFLAGLVIGAVRNFCKGADDVPTWKHVSTIPGLDAPTIPGQRGSGRVRGDVNRYVAKAIEPAIRRAWADLSNEEGGLPFTKSMAFSVYLKLWQLSKPIIPANFILFDEAQDASPVMVDVVARQADPEFRASRGLAPAQIVWVGDSQQAINGFTGAINALQTMPYDHRAFLTQSFRFGPAIADVANHILGLIPDAELRLTGFDEIASVVEPLLDPDCILTRTNATAVRAVLEAQRDEKTVHLVGGGKDVVEFAKAARNLMDGIKVDHPELACFDDWAEVQEYVEQDEQGGDLKLLVKLVDEFGVDEILEALDQQVSEDEAELVVSTTHKAKGREWGTVQIAADFPEDRLARGDESATDELRLLYVAVTRARLVLDVSAIEFLSHGVAPNPTPAVEPEPVARVERAPRKRSEHVGTIGSRVEFVGRLVSAKPIVSRFGPTHLTRFVDDDGNVYVAFIDDETPDGHYLVTGRVSKHGEYNGTLETTVNYVDLLEAVETPPAPTTTATVGA